MYTLCAADLTLHTVVSASVQQQYNNTNNNAKNSDNDDNKYADVDALPDHEQELGPQEGCHHVPGGSLQPCGALCHQVSHCQHTQIWYYHLCRFLKALLHAMTLAQDVCASSCLPDSDCKLLRASICSGSPYHDLASAFVTSELHICSS